MCRNSDTVDYEDSCLIVRYLASMRPFAQSFDIYLTQVRGHYFSVYIFSHCTKQVTITNFYAVDLESPR